MKYFNETVQTILIALLLAVLFRTFAFEPYTVPTGSMKPEIEEGDYLFISKYAYGYSRYSFPFSIPIIEGRAFHKSPKRGDVAVLKHPKDPKTIYIKRIIGLPGDKIQVNRGILSINGQSVELERIGEYEYNDGTERKKSLFNETLPNGKQHEIIQDNIYAPMQNTGIYTVPEKHVFVMGDNRDGSKDSRYSDAVGFIPEENLIGRAEIFFFSIRPNKDWWAFWSWYDRLRFERFFKNVN